MQNPIQQYRSRYTSRPGKEWVSTRIKVSVYQRLKDVQTEQLLTLSDTISLLIDVYNDVKSGRLVPRNLCRS